MKILELNKDWKIRWEDLDCSEKSAPLIQQKDDWEMLADLPCDIHMPLIRYGHIKEPLEADNYMHCQWTRQKSWWFMKTFNVDEDLLEGELIELTLESIDTGADIFLNGYHLGSHANAHYPFEAKVRQVLRKGENILLVRVTTGVEEINEFNLAEIKNCVPVMGDGITKGDERRVYARKPQFVFGWDWAPRLVTCGITGSVYVSSYKTAVIRTVHARTLEVTDSAKVKVDVEVENVHPYSTSEAVIRIQILFGDQLIAQARKNIILTSGLNYPEFAFDIANPELWWPNGMGEQNLYTVKVEMDAEGEHSFYPEFRIGIRTLRINQDSINEDHHLFAIEINGIRTFSKGGNWVPADSIYSRVSDSKYDTLVREAANANMNMLRVWGGGIYEKDVFYRKCDEYGIMVWQDFMFACGLYPDHLEGFRNIVEKEMEYQTRRLRNHASLVIWSGNNECQEGYVDWWDGYKKGWDFLGANCYNFIAPRAVKRNCSEIPYWNGSPYGGKTPNGRDMGDCHYWDAYKDQNNPDRKITPEEYDSVTAKFVSEYGYAGPCSKSSIIQYHGENPVVYRDEIWKLHTHGVLRTHGNEAIYKHYGREADNIDDFILFGGLYQGLMLQYSLESLRYKEFCSGALIWMYNDCWGESGWTIIDYYTRRKISYYFVKRALEHIKLIMREENGMVKVMGINETSETVSFKVAYGYVKFDASIKESAETDIRIPPYSREKVLEFEKNSYDQSEGVYFIDPLGSIKEVATATLRGGEIKSLKLEKTKLKIYNMEQHADNLSFMVESSFYAHAVYFGIGDDIRLSDEYFDLLPGSARKIVVYGDGKTDLISEKITARCFNDLL
ncbi:MAG TPA: sugar-binding domain-containing protein [Ruminiclostridium sp.]